jgi:hypothetical protein
LKTTFLGTLEGWFFVSSVLDQSEFLHTSGSHQLVVAKVDDALRDKTQCLWLRAGGLVSKVASAILAVSVAVQIMYNHHKPLCGALSLLHISCVYTKLSRTEQLPILYCLIGDDLDEERNLRRLIDAEMSFNELTEDESTFKNWKNSYFSDGFETDDRK